MQWKQITQLSSAKANSSGGAGVLARGRQTVISGNLIYGLFMYFCIYLDILELESWAVAELHAPALHSAGYLLWGSWAQSWPWPGWVLPWGPPGWGLSLGRSLQACPGPLLHSQRGGAGWECQGQLLVPAGWACEGCGGPCREQRGRETPRRGWWPLGILLLCFHSSLPSAKPAAGMPRVSIDPTGESPALLWSRSPLPAQGRTLWQESWGHCLLSLPLIPSSSDLTNTLSTPLFPCWRF